MVRWLSRCLAALTLLGTPLSADAVKRVEAVPGVFLRDWLLLGPFFSPSNGGTGWRLHDRPDGLDRDFLAPVGGEAAADPRAGDTVPNQSGAPLTWTRHRSVADLVDLAAVFGPNNANVVAYAYTIVEAPEPMLALLGVGSDDGVAIWLGGERVHYRHLPRGARIDDDYVVVRLQKGANRLLVKVDDSGGDWGFMLRFLDAEAHRAGMARFFAERMRFRVRRAVLAAGDTLKAWAGTDARYRLLGELGVDVTVQDASGGEIGGFSGALLDTLRWAVPDLPWGLYTLSASIQRPDRGTERFDRPFLVGVPQTVARELRDAVAERQRATGPDESAVWPLEVAAHQIDRFFRAYHRLYDNPSRWVRWYWVRLLADAQGLLRRLDAGDEPLAHRRGVFTRFYRSGIERSLQPFGLYAPRSYRRGEPTPMVMVLHGHDPYHGGFDNQIEHWVWSFRTIAEERGWLVVVPYGRGNTDYEGLGAVDIHEVLEAVASLYTVDESRRYLTGYAMGGTGTWSIGAKFPGIFAAIAPVMGETDYRLVQRSLPRSARPSFEAGNTLHYAPNLVGTSIYAVHGVGDPVTSVEHTRHMVARLDSLGYDVTYDERTDMGHAAVPAQWTRLFPRGLWEGIFGWFAGTVRDRYPLHVRLVTARLAYGRHAWVRVDALNRAYHFADIDARVERSGLVRVEALGVDAFTLELTRGLVRDRSVRVDINGRRAYRGRTRSVSFVRDAKAIGDRPRFRTGKLKRDGLWKRKGLEGPISEARESPFILVYGTGETDPDGRRVDFEEAAQELRRWQRWQQTSCGFRADTLLTSEEIATHNLVLFGTPRSNGLLRRIAPSLPIVVEEGRIRIGEEVLEGDDLGLGLIYPNPLAPERYVVYAAATHWRALKGITRRLSDLGWCDYHIFSLDRSDDSDRTITGYFDLRWQLDPALTFRGEDARHPFRVPRSRLWWERE